MGILTADQVNKFQSTLDQRLRDAAAPSPAEQMALQQQQQREEGLLQQIQQGPSPQAIEGALRSPYVDGGAKQGALDSISARQQLSSSANVLGPENLTNFMMKVIERSTSGDSIPEKLQEAQLQRVFDQVKKGEINPQNQAEVIREALKPAANKRMELNAELQKEIQGQLYKGDEVLMGLHDLTDNFNREFFLVKQQGKKELGDLYGKYGGRLPADMERFGAAMDIFKGNLARTKLAIKAYYLPGARVPPAIQKLIDQGSIHKDLDPDQFIAAAKGLTIALEKAQAVKAQLLKDNIVPGVVPVADYRKAQQAAEKAYVAAHPEASDAYIDEAAHRASVKINPDEVLIRDYMLKNNIPIVNK